jgi:formylglycine-generating enzyme required for sulfatase activity
MGSERGDDDEQPVHTVVLTKGFWIGRYVVTNDDYRRFMEAKKGTVGTPKYWDDRKFNQPKQPVVGVSWHDAAAYCEWAKGRLPTEAEWEYACRAGSQYEYCFGDDESQLGEYGWYAVNSGWAPHPVGGRKPNAWGLYDMHGNVWEWCRDSKRTYEKKNVKDPIGAATVESRAIRGGSWSNHAGNVRCAYRNQSSPGIQFDYLGFRLVRVQERS